MARMGLREARGRHLTQDDFAAIIRRIRAANDDEIGPGASAPDPR